MFASVMSCRGEGASQSTSTAHTYTHTHTHSVTAKPWRHDVQSRTRHRSLGRARTCWECRTEGCSQTAGVNQHRWRDGWMDTQMTDQGIGQCVGEDVVMASLASTSPTSSINSCGERVCMRMCVCVCEWMCMCMYVCVCV